MRKMLALCLLALLLTACGAQKETVVATAAPDTQPETTVQTQPETLPETQPETTQPPAPITADQLADGSYEITVDSSSSMFKVVKCVLTVKDGAMTADMTMSGQGYGAVFMGTGAEAPASPEESPCIAFKQDAEGAKVFTVPVEALNQPVDCAAWSIRKEKWYDRVLVFQGDALPQEALKG